MFADELRRAVEAAPRITLPSITALLWRAFGAGQVTEDEAAEIEALIEVRRVSSGAGKNLPDPGKALPAADRAGSPRKPAGSRPRTGASLERRRRWAASGRLPPALAARFTLAEQAVLALIAAETARRGDCRLAIGHVAAITGVSETTVRNAIRQARVLGLVTIEERRITGFRNDTNVVRIVSPEWQAWLRLARRSPEQGSGCKSAKGTPTEVLELRGKRPSTASQGLPGTGGRPRRKSETGIGAAGSGGRAMR